MGTLLVLGCIWLCIILIFLIYWLLNKRPGANHTITALKLILQISPEEAHSGCQKTITLRRLSYDAIDGKPDKEEASVTIHVPAGVDGETPLRISGEGEQDYFNKRSTDLYVILEIVESA